MIAYTLAMTKGCPYDTVFDWYVKFHIVAEMGYLYLLYTSLDKTISLMEQLRARLAFDLYTTLFNIGYSLFAMGAISEYAIFIECPVDVVIYCDEPEHMIDEGPDTEVTDDTTEVNEEGMEKPIPICGMEDRFIKPEDMED